MKKLLALFLAVLTVLSLAACGGKGGDQPAVTPADLGTDLIFEGNGDYETPVALGTPEVALDPQQVYQKLTYTPEMFYGHYQLLGGSDAEKEWAEEQEYVDYVAEDREVLLSKFPLSMKAGPYTWSHYVHEIKEYDWAEVYFYQKSAEGEEANLTFIKCAYSVEGNKLTLKPLKDFNVDTDTNEITYAFSDYEFVYEFSFKGRELTLSKDGQSVTMFTGLDPYGEKLYVFEDGWLSKGSKALDGIEGLMLHYDVNGENSYRRIHVELSTGEDSDAASAKMESNGLLTFTVPWESGTKTYQYVYFLCGRDGIVLTDGTNTYYYNEDYFGRKKEELNAFLTEDQSAKLEDITEPELEDLVEKKENLVEDLVAAFDAAGIEVTVNEELGELAMDATVLFGGDSSELTEDGKVLLNKFLDAYTSIVFSEKYEGFVSKTLVEGHTAPLANSTYESGLRLSQERADVVKAYCLSEETGVDTSKLAAALEAVGCSNSRPILDEDGQVDLDACRRVSFKFIINIG